jgi:hypothetical protein
MLGRGVFGEQSWALSRSGPDLILLVLEREGHEFARAVLASEDPAPIARALTESEPDITKSGSITPVFSNSAYSDGLPPYPH